MSSIISRFVSGRTAAKAPQQRQQIANVGDTVSRADFDKLAQVVNTMTKAIEGLIEDFDAMASPERLQTLVNAAFKGVSSGGRPPLALKADQGFLAPKDDDDGGVRVNTGQKGRAPLALPADIIFLAPQGD
jgi:hypothetical protein